MGAVCVRRPTYIAIPFLLRNKNRPLTALVVAYFVLTSSAWCLLYAAWTVPAALLWCMWATGADEQELPRMKRMSPNAYSECTEAGRRTDDERRCA